MIQNTQEIRRTLFDKTTQNKILLSCFVLSKSVLLISCVFWVFIQNAGSQLCFRFFCLFVLTCGWNIGTKNKKKEQIHFDIFTRFKLRDNRIQIRADLADLGGESCVFYRIVYSGFDVSKGRKFTQKLSIRHAVQLPSGANKLGINKMTEEKPYISTSEICFKFDLSRVTVKRIPPTWKNKQKPNNNNKNAGWTLYLLTEDQKKQTVLSLKVLQKYFDLVAQND